MVAVLFVVILAAMILAAIANRPKPTLDDYPLATCTAITPPSGRVFYIDPQRGSPDGDGSRERPWHDLQFLVEQGLLGEYERRVSWTEKGLAWLTRRPAVTHLRKRAKALIRGGDTVLLASGQYRPIDLSRIENTDFITIAAAPGADLRISGLDLTGASHFVLRGLRIRPSDALGPNSSLVTALAIPWGRPDNLVFDDIEVAGPLAVSQTDPETFAATAPRGLRISGDCLTLRRSAFHDLRSAIAVYLSRNVVVERNTIRDISVDGIAFTGRHIAIRGNLIFNQWPTPDKSHPDCMQGQNLTAAVLGPIDITDNACLQQVTATGERPAVWRGKDQFGFMGINIFTGRWRDITVRCNLVMPRAQHGMGLYGLKDSIIEYNVVAGNPNDRLSWIAAMPSHDGQPPENLIIRGNRATGYLNAVHGGGLSPDAMIDFIKAKRQDEALMAALKRPITGVSLQDNEWMVPSHLQSPLSADTRFRWTEIGPVTPPADLKEALDRYPKPAACGRAL